MRRLTLIVDKSGYLPSLQNEPRKSSRSKLQIMAPASFLFTANSHFQRIKPKKRLDSCVYSGMI